MTLPEPKISREVAMRMWISEHSEFAKEQVVLGNIGLVVDVLKKFKKTSDEDLFSTGVLGLLKAINTFDAEKGYAFSTYASRCILNEVLMVFRNKESEVLSLDNEFDLNGEKIPFLETFSDGRNYEEEVIESWCFSEFSKTLSDREKRVLHLLSEGKNQTEIAREIGMSQTMISRTIRKCKERYKRKYMGRS